MRVALIVIASIGCTDGTTTESMLDPTGPGWQIGAEGTPAVEVESVWAPRTDLEVTDLAFDPMHDNRVWVMMRPRYEGNGELRCEGNDQSGCDFMESRTATIDNPGLAGEDVTLITDDNGWHFMRRTVAMAMGDDTGFWASCGDFWTGNLTDSAVQFIGPSLWSSDLSVHGVTPPGLNGSHFDMLHGTPWCTGIAWEVDNVYWALNGERGAIDRVDFNADHGPGQDDHSDGEYERFAEGEFGHIEGVPSHMEIDGDWLYIADAGNNRVARLDITSGTEGSGSTTFDPVPVVDIERATVEDFVGSDAGLRRPSGLAVHDGVVFVSEFRQAIIHAYETEKGTLLGSIDVSDTVETVTGLEISPEGWLYFADMDGGAVYRLVPAPETTTTTNE